MSVSSLCCMYNMQQQHGICDLETPMGFFMSTLENDVLIPKCNLLHNSTSQQGFQLKDGLRVIWNRVEQMEAPALI